jgi:tetratricopeptide (TPR) repeat protein
LSPSARERLPAELSAGRWPSACESAQQSLKYAIEASDTAQLKGAYSLLGAAYVGLGKLQNARDHFQKAAAFAVEELLDSVSDLWEVELLLAVGDLKSAEAQARKHLERCKQANRARDAAVWETLLGRCSLPDAPSEARPHLDAAREYAYRSGAVEVLLRCYYLAAAIAGYEGDYPLAVREAEDGIQLADSCGFGRWSLDLRSELARIRLSRGETGPAINLAEWVSTRSQERECDYAWGVADSLHLLGIAHAQLGDTEKARQYLSNALDKRKLLQHPGVMETEAEFRKLSG